jgi:endogenous inhibitor of DNA gyrase (YacG/DUF329 family)
MPPFVICPICQRRADFSADPEGPFCSVRCKNIDLGNWLAEDYHISDPLTPDHLNGYAEMTGPELDVPEP